ncbi:tail fiber assembly protein [Mangrovibacter phragmitis]|uniref:tail fiber assembly protein n=1 Tax=Mangrovibacter phragmitis TaxID=1691903 RepID=UPI00336A2823
MYLFSKTTLGFYPVADKQAYINAGTLPDDVIEVDDNVRDTYNAQAPLGKKLDVDSDGMPVWVDLPAPTASELIAQAKIKQESLLTSAKNTISVWQSELLLGIISDADKATLTAWIPYIKELQALDFSSITDEASYDAFAWPDAPESLS